MSYRSRVFIRDTGYLIKTLQVDKFHIDAITEMAICC